MRLLNFPEQSYIWTNICFPVLRKMSLIVNPQSDWYSPWYSHSFGPDRTAYRWFVPNKWFSYLWPRC